MKLNHANLATADVAGLCDFFTSHFGFELLDMRGKDAFAAGAAATALPST